MRQSFVVEGGEWVGDPHVLFVFVDYGGEC